MWNVVVMTAMVATAGYFITASERHVIATETNTAVQLAGEMATYRQAVIAHFDGNRALKDISVPNEAIPFPYWVRQSGVARWANYIDSAGVVYVFASDALPTNITAEIAKLSMNSVLAGEAASDAAGQLFLSVPSQARARRQTSPRDYEDVTPSAAGYVGQVGLYPAISLPADAAIPAGSPVWLAHSVREPT